MLELGLYPYQSIKISTGFDYLKHASDYGLFHHLTKIFLP
jgi:hypothetical protein